MKFSGVEFELFVANFYKNKVKNCQDRGIEFKLTLTSMRNMLRTRKCPYLGIELTVLQTSALTVSTTPRATSPAM